MTPVEELVDGGNQGTVRMADWRPRVDAASCVRGRCKNKVAEGHGFCRDCLEWLTERSDDDPLDDGEEVAKLQTPPEMWDRYDPTRPPYENHLRERGAP